MSFWTSIHRRTDYSFDLLHWKTVKVNSYATELFAAVFRSFEAGIADTISSFKWRKKSYIYFVTSSFKWRKNLYI